MNIANLSRAAFIGGAMLASACGNSGASDAAQDDAALSTPAAMGRSAFSECAICHTARENDAHRIGPNLFGVFGREAGTADGFAYSGAMRDSGVVWTDENLDAFLTNPQKFMRGNRMAFVGESDAETRAALIAYLKTLQPAEAEN